MLKHSCLGQWEVILGKEDWVIAHYRLHVCGNSDFSASSESGNTSKIFYFPFAYSADKYYIIVVHFSSFYFY